MRSLLIPVLGMILCILRQPGWTQDRVDKQNQPEMPCTPFPPQNVQPRDIPVIGISFSGNLQMPVADQNQIASELKRFTYSESFTGAGEELVERVRLAWQNRGFLKVEVNGDAVLTGRGADRGLALSVHVNEGPQYRLGGISFQHNRALANVKSLRALFPIEDGEFFSRSKVAAGFANLRRAYGELGYINNVGVPDTNFDDETHKIYIVADIDEGRQFLVDKVEVLGVDRATRQALLRKSLLHSRDVYNARLDELFLGRIKSQYPGCGCADIKHNQIDERAGTVVLTYDLHSCAGK